MVDLHPPKCDEVHRAPLADMTEHWKNHAIPVYEPLVQPSIHPYSEAELPKATYVHRQLELHQSPRLMRVPLLPYRKLVIHACTPNAHPKRRYRSQCRYMFLPSIPMLFSDGQRRAGPSAVCLPALHDPLLPA
jgi:hypothetical protein